MTDLRAFRFLPCLLVIGLFTLPAFSADMSEVTDPETGLTSWKWHGGQARLSLSQLLPDQVRAFFQGRGFTAEQSERIAGFCVFQTVVRNEAEADEPLEVDITDWRVLRDGMESGTPRTAASWDTEWQSRDTGQAPRIAFRWALFPTSQTFAPGDWNMGMLTLDLPAGETFDLHIGWRRDGQTKNLEMTGISCAEDR